MVFSSSVMEANFFTMERRREMAEAEQRALHMLTIQELRQVHAGGRRSGLRAYTRIACMHLMPPSCHMRPTSFQGIAFMEYRFSIVHNVARSALT